MTLFQLITMIIAVLLMSAGMVIGRQCGIGWGILGAVAGLMIGLRIGHALDMRILKPTVLAVRAQTTEGLKASLRDRTTWTPQLVLLELRGRGEVSQEDLGYVLDMLESESEMARRHGWVALISAFPELAEQARGYRISAPLSDCRAKVAKLRTDIDWDRAMGADG